MPSEHGLPLVSGGGVLSARPEVAVETGCRQEKRLAEVKVQLLRLLSLGLVIDPELPDPGLECENRSRGKPRATNFSVYKGSDSCWTSGLQKEDPDTLLGKPWCPDSKRNEMCA